MRHKEIHKPSVLRAMPRNLDHTRLALPVLTINTTPTTADNPKIMATRTPDKAMMSPRVHPPAVIVSHSPFQFISIHTTLVLSSVFFFSLSLVIPWDRSANSTFLPLRLQLNQTYRTCSTHDWRYTYWKHDGSDSL